MMENTINIIITLTFCFSFSGITAKNYPIAPLSRMSILTTFLNMKSNYTTDATNIHTCSMYFPNTCAIRMSEAIVKTENRYLAGFKNSSKNKCPHSYVRGAQDLAAILAQPNHLGTRTYGWSGNPLATVPGAAKGKQGIICFINIPGFSGQGHIDLWDKNSAVGSDYWDAKTIWFWELSA